MDKAEAIKAAKNGAVAAIISGGVTLGITIIALFSNTDGDFVLWNDPSNIVDVILIFGCAFGMYRNSRSAAVIIFIYFILSKIIIGLSMGHIPGLLSLIFLYYYGKAIQGTFAFHRLEKANNSEYKAPPRWYAFVGIPLGLIAIAAIGFGALTMTGAVPSTEVLPGDKLPRSEIQTLLSEGIVEEDEKIEYFYSAGLASILDDGNLLTDRRVISYFINDENELEVYELFIPNIRNVELVQQGNYLNDSVYQVNSYDEDVWLWIVLSTEAGGDVRFVEALRKKIDQSP